MTRTKAKGASRFAGEESPHCAYCGAFLPPGEAFCNERERALFARLVANAKRGGPAPLNTSKQRGGAHGKTSPGLAPSVRRRPLERVRAEQA